MFPSSSRSLASREGRCLRDRNGGRIRICQGTRCECCLPASPNGPIDLAVTKADLWSPLRTGRSVVTSRTRCPGAIFTSCIRGSALALGDHASRTCPRKRRGPGFSTSRTASTGCPSLAVVSPDRVKTSRRVLAARRMSSTIAAASAPARTANAVAGHGDNATGSTQASATKPARPVRTTTVAPVRLRESRPARRRDERLRARPPDATGYDAATSAAPSP